MARRRIGRGVAASMMVMALVGAASTSAGAATLRGNSVSAAKTNALLGPVNQAKGTPVKIGLLSAGTSATSDNSSETPIAEATVKWINKHRGGVGGHPIQLDICNDDGDPSKGVDCANQLITDRVAAVATQGTSVLTTEWGPLHDAGIPLYSLAGSDQKLLNDTQSTFVLANPYAVLADLPIGLAKSTKAKTVTAVLIDVPTAISAYKNPDVLDSYKKKGVKLDIVPVAIGTADMTPQMQQVVDGNPKGVVEVVGTDSFCIAAFNGLRTAGFKGTVVALPVCITDATRKAVPGEFLKGIKISATDPAGDPKDPSVQQYLAVLKTFGADVKLDDAARGIGTFSTLAALSASTQGLKGDPTSTNLIAATKAKPTMELAGSGGQHFRCNGKATTLGAAICTRSALSATLNSKGLPSSYQVVNDTPIED
jgi:branched-chain amino acid transport system substrate-binding protein